MLSCILFSCSEETASEYERVKTGFLETIQGNIDPSQTWRTAVGLDVNVGSKDKAELKTYVTFDRKRYLTDKKNIPAGGGKVTMTVPQGMGNSIGLAAKTSAKMVNQNITLTGMPEQTVSIDIDSRAIIADSRAATFPLSRAESAFHPNDYATHDPDPSLYGKSICGGGYYKDWGLKDWHYICDLAVQSSSLEEKGEIVNYELVSKGKFSITLLCGYKKNTRPRIFGYYYHSPGTYSDIRFIDMFDTHSYDFLDNKGLIQYKVNGDNDWYNLNFQIDDKPGDDGNAGKNRQGDNVFNSIFVSRHYRDEISNVQGLTYDIDVPVGMHIGFFMRQEDLKEEQQYNHLIELGLPEDNLQLPFKAYNFSAKQFNLEGTHRSWVHDAGNWYFMGLEDIIDGGDFDDNDMMFGITDPVGVDHLPEIVDPDIDHMGEKEDEDEVLPWTLAFEDIYRNADFDFNDGVIRLVPDFDNQRVCIKVLAAGIDEQVYLHYEAPDGTDMVLGELHELLGRSVDEFVNTTGNVVEVPGVEVDCVPWPEFFTMEDDIRRFSLEVVRGDCHGQCSDWLQMTVSPGQLPQAILVAGDWNWPREGYNINNVYSYFNYWAKDATNLNYWEWYHTPKAGTYVCY